MRPSPGCSRLEAFRLYSLSSSTIRLASKRGIQVRVLLVDDDAAIARSIELMLKIEEINVYRTDLGEEGVDLGKIYDYDIILLDLNLPDISGYEVLRSLLSAKVVTPAATPIATEPRPATRVVQAPGPGQNSPRRRRSRRSRG
jgi:CheY-like chemotaxis protein